MPTKPPLTNAAFAARTPASVWEAVSAIGFEDRWLRSRERDIPLAALAQASAIAGAPDRIAGRSVLLATSDQLGAALSFIALDGVARRLTVCPPGFPEEYLPEIARKAEVDAIVTDQDPSRFESIEGCEIVPCGIDLPGTRPTPPAAHATEWVLFTSGTTGLPKLAVHSFAALTGAIRTSIQRAPHVWATFYDIRRYGGMQIFMRAMLGNASLGLSSASEPVADHLRRLAECGVTHMSGTPSHWRRVLMSATTAGFAPRTVRLSGEIADQAVLDGLRALFPAASVGHAYASTEAGVGFEVNDGLAGFPVSYVDGGCGEVEMKVEEGSLFIRSPRTAARYLGERNRVLLREDGFVDTGDGVERRGDRYYFTGRRDGIINVGVQKVNPEEVEAVINRHPLVSLSLVRSQRNPIMGAIVVADVVLNRKEAGELPPDRRAALQRDILQACRLELPAHKVPALIRFLPALDLTPGGKLARSHA
jgi:acyl-coenzyme A synthetase/AMP-(fatty) acid ligase